VARTFVNVRSAPASNSAVQGVVAENATVFLGDTRGAWRQIRSGGVAGWVWEPLFNVGSEGP
jgi:SH3-like domain-containing protein